MTKLELGIGITAILVWGAAIFKAGNGIQAKEDFAPYQKFIKTPFKASRNPVTDEYSYSTEDGKTLFYSSSGTMSNGNGGIPKSDAERAMNHYGVGLDEYLACPECYPLPPRGMGLNRTGR